MVRTDRQLAGQRGHLWQQLAEVDARHAGADRVVLAADLGRSLRLGIERLVLRRAAGQEHDQAGASRPNRLVRHPRPEGAPRQRGQRQTQAPEPADPQPLAAQLAAGGSGTIAGSRIRVAADRTVSGRRRSHGKPRTAITTFGRRFGESPF